jgi:hypothetical protein
MHGLLTVKFNWKISVIIIYTLWFLCYVCVVFGRGLVSLCCKISEINKSSITRAITNLYDISSLNLLRDDIVILLYVSSLIHVSIVSPQYSW